MRKIAVFADVQNIYYTTRQAYQRQFNYYKFWENCQAKGKIIVANAYAINRGDSQQQKFQNTLQKIGFTIRLKPYIQRSDGSSKGDWDVGITIDVMEAAVEADIVILLSGDGDFDLLLQKINDTYSVSTHVYGVPKLTAKSLINAASVYVPIEEELLL